MLGAEAQSAEPLIGVYSVPANSNARLSPKAPAVESIKLIDSDFATFGGSATRARLQARWNAEIAPASDPDN